MLKIGDHIQQNVSRLTESPTCCTKEDNSSIVPLNQLLQERLDCPVMQASGSGVWPITVVHFVLFVAVQTSVLSVEAIQPCIMHLKVSYGFGSTAEGRTTATRFRDSRRSCLPAATC